MNAFRETKTGFATASSSLFEAPERFLPRGNCGKTSVTSATSVFFSGRNQKRWTLKTAGLAALLRVRAKAKRSEKNARECISRPKETPPFSAERHRS
jgi:hypothetical protein